MNNVATVVSVVSLIISLLIVMSFAGMSIRLKNETVRQVKSEMLQCGEQLKRTHKLVERLEKQLAIQTGVNAEMAELLRSRRIKLPPHVAAVIDILGFKRQMVTIKDVIGAELNGDEIRGLLSWIAGKSPSSHDKDENITELMNAIAHDPDALEKLKRAMSFINGTHLSGIMGAAFPDGTGALDATLDSITK